MNKREWMASGEGIDCYRVGRRRFVAVDTRDGTRHEGGTMYAAIRRALEARGKLTR